MSNLLAVLRTGLVYKGMHPEASYLFTKGGVARINKVPHLFVENPKGYKLVFSTKKLLRVDARAFDPYHHLVSSPNSGTVPGARDLDQLIRALGCSPELDILSSGASFETRVRTTKLSSYQYMVAPRVLTTGLTAGESFYGTPP